MREGQLTKGRRDALGRMLSWLRVQQGMSTRTALRDASGVSLTTLKNLEEGRTAKPREEILHQLDKALGLPPQTLVFYARGELTTNEVRDIVGRAEGPVWARVPVPQPAPVGSDDPVQTLVDVLGAATKEQQLRAIAAALNVLREKPGGERE